MLPQVNLIRTLNGDFMSLYDRAGISGVLMSYGAWDELTLALAKTLTDLVDTKPVVLDVGANMGTFSVALSRYIAPKQGILHCFEPQKIIYYQLCGNLFLNRIDNATAHNVALSDTDAWKEIPRLNFHTAINIGAYSLVPDKDQQQKEPLAEKCEFKKLDNFDLSDKITLIKIDVEGFETEVLSGASNRIAADGYPPILFEIIEGDARAEQVKAILTDMGYRLSQYATQDWLAQHPEWPAEISVVPTETGMGYIRIR